MKPGSMTLVYRAVVYKTSETVVYRNKTVVYKTSETVVYRNETVVYKTSETVVYRKQDSFLYTTVSLVLYTNVSVHKCLIPMKDTVDYVGTTNKD